MFRKIVTRNSCYPQEMIAALLVLALALQDDVPPPQGEIDKAIKKGADALVARVPSVIESKTAYNFNRGYEYDSLLLFTLVHSGIPLTDDTMQALLGKVL